VRSVTLTDRVPWSSGRAVVRFSRSPGAGAATAAHPVHLKVVRHDYFETFGLDVLAGRAFSPERETEPTPLGETESVVLDHAYAELLGFASPQAAIGQIVYGGPDGQPFRVIGVTETEATRLEASEVIGHIYVFSQWRSGSAQFPIVRVDRDDVAGALASITRTWDGFAPNAPANIRFFDELFARGFAGYARAGQLFMLLSASAFVIASIGMLGIAVHVASRRRREVAIRKTLGSSAMRVVRLLLTDFSKPVLIGNLAAWPLAWIASEAYLRSFAERLDLGFMPFGLSLAATLFIAWMAVGGVVLRAANEHPAKVLRHA
jgi:putative ABC transport system permease protein